MVLYTTGMKIYSWNMLYSNEETDRAFEFIKALDFDVFCLQEVPEGFLTRLKTLPFYLASGAELDWLETSGSIGRIYSVILSKHNIRSVHNFAFPELEWPRRTSLFVRVMYRWGWRRFKNRRSVYADIELPSGLTRVFSLHLTLSYPQRLMLEFETAAALRDPKMPTLMCGDFNIIESLRVTPLNWILGGQMQDIVRPARSRRGAEKRFAELGFKNPLRGKRTQTISFSQLDHILVPQQFKVLKAEVLPDRVGSDHHPILVECEA
jgi:endonuclease/exonuclease/phosphatase family metal-dependent hydrolase